jgi:hypothetical protein
MNLIRKISAAKWQDCLSISATHITADAVTACLRTQENTLSLWSFTNDDEHAKSLLALACSLTSLSTIDITYISPQELASQSLTIHPNTASTPATKSNSLHVDIVNLDYSLLEKVANIVKANVANGDFKRITKPEIRKILISAIEQGEINSSALPERLQRDLGVYIEPVSA